ncbi:hypothetical protein KL920_002851 [Ogataea angusta]|nr:hypothetical protein KL920_002851 [Ogataea angusta]
MSVTDVPVLKRARLYMATNRRLAVVLVVLLYWVVQNVWTWSPGARELAQVDAKIEAELSSNLHTFGAHLRHLNRLPAAATLREKLTFYFPYYPEKPVPNQIWQTWKVDLEDADFPKQYRRFQKTWVEKNPDYVYHLIPDSVIEDFVASLYANVPEVVRAYQLLPKNIMKADFFRYLVVYARGGTYSDMDTVCLKPIKDWATFDRDLIHAADTKADLSQIDPDARTTPTAVLPVDDPGEARAPAAARPDHPDRGGDVPQTAHGRAEKGGGQGLGRRHHAVDRAGDIHRHSVRLSEQRGERRQAGRRVRRGVFVLAQARQVQAEKDGGRQEQRAVALGGPADQLADADQHGQAKDPGGRDGVADHELQPERGAHGLKEQLR